MSIPEITTPPTPRGKPAVTINIQSWATPIIGFVMLVIGLAGGYLARPALNPSATPNSPLVDVPATISPGQSSLAQQETGTAPTPDLMEYLIGQTHHFQGDPNAKVVFIEFSDFQ